MRNPKKIEKNEAMKDSEVENVGEREDDEGLSTAVPAALVKHTMKHTMRNNPDKKKMCRPL